MQDNFKLGIFVLAGLLVLVLMLYFIGKNRNLFGANYILRARFENVQGLKAGNNVRYAGIDVGTVKSIDILNDTMLEVSMIIEDKMKPIIRENAIVSIGTDGFVGNKLVNISPSHLSAGLARENDLLTVKKSFDTDELLRSFNRTGQDISSLSNSIKVTFDKINKNSTLWKVLDDEQLASSLRRTAANIEQASVNTDKFIKDLQMLSSDLAAGKGSLGQLLKDSSLSIGLKSAVVKINGVGQEAEKLAVRLQDLSSEISAGLHYEKGTVNSLLYDSVWTRNIRTSLNQLDSGTHSFKELMNALKSSVFFRKYFRKQRLNQGVK